MRLRGARSRAVLLAIMVALSSAAVGVPPASATGASLHVRAVAGVQAQGAGLAVEVGLTCPAEPSPFALLVTATQRQADGAVVTGKGVIEVSCLGTAQVIRSAVSAVGFGMEAGTGARFRPGVASVSARLDYCGLFACQVLRAARIVQTPALLLDHARSISPYATVNLPATATLEADGAGARIRIFHRCDNFLYPSRFEARLVQRTTASSVSGTEDAGITLSCTGASQSAVLDFHAAATAWRAGAALLIVRGLACPEEHVCRVINAHRTLTLT